MKITAHVRVTQGEGCDGTNGADDAVSERLEFARFSQAREGMDSGGAEKKNGVAMSDCFPADGVYFRSVDCSIGDDFGDFSAKFLQAWNKFRGGAIASRKKYTLPAELECKLVDKSCGGSALADVGNFETSQLRCFGRGFAEL